MRSPIPLAALPRWTLCLAMLAGLFAGAAHCEAQSTQPNIAFIFPAGGQRGKTVEATVAGDGLKGATAVWISGKGVTGSILADDIPAAMSKPNRDSSAPKKPKPWINSAVARNSVRLSIVIAPDAPLGQHDLRLVTPAGVSGLCRFVVDELPELVVTEPNSVKADAVQLVTLPVVVNGQIYSGWTGATGVVGSPDRGYYRLTAKAGQTLVFQCEAQAFRPYIDQAVPGWFDGCLTLCDAGGKRLAYVDDFRFHPDPVLIYKVEQDGEYLLEVRDVIYRSSHDFVYRLRIGTLPYLTHIFPLGGRRGAEVNVELHGVNLAQDRLPVKISADSSAVRMVCSPAGGLTSNGLPFAAGDLPEVLETEPNDSLAKAQHVTLPVTINGRIQNSGDEDYFAFKAEEGQKLVMEVHARRLDSPLDSVLTLFDAAGRELAENDDPPPQAVPNNRGDGVEVDRSVNTDPLDALTTHTADSRLVYTFAKGGDYAVRIRDAQEKGGEEYAYRLTIAPARSDFVLRLHTSATVLAQGDSAVLGVSALRKNDFDGAIRLAVHDLPPGLVASEAVIAATADEAQLTITAAADAKPGFFCPTVVGVVDEQQVQAFPVESLLQAFYVRHLVPTQGCPLEVRKVEAFTLSAEVPRGKPLEVPQGGEAQVVLKVARMADARFPVNVAALPAFRAIPPKQFSAKLREIGAKAVSIPADKDEATITLNVPRAMPAGGVYNVILAGTMSLGKQTVTRIAPAIGVKVVADPRNSPGFRGASRSAGK
jgi:hypothetical protein